MSERYVGAWEQAGLFNPLVAPTPQYTYNLYAWGINTQGQLGLGNTTSYSSPKQVGSLANWAAPLPNGGGGINATVLVKTDGTLWSWGDGSNGQLGLGSTTKYSSPKQVGALTNWSGVTSANDNFCVAIKTNGTLWAWGNNALGQLGLGNTTYYSSPVQVGALTTWSKIGTSGYSAYAIKTDGTLWSWGYNAYGQLGLGNRTNYSSPKQVGSLTNWALVSGGIYFVYGVKTDGTLWAWGFGGGGNLGQGNLTNYSSPKQVGALTNWKSAVGNGNLASMALKTDGTLWAWGLDSVGQLGLGTNSGSYIQSPTQVGALSNWNQPIGGFNFFIASKTDGTLWSWGANTSGQGGLGTRTTYSSPKQIGALSSWSSGFASYNSGYGLAY